MSLTAINKKRRTVGYLLKLQAHQLQETKQELANIVEKRVSMEHQLGAITEEIFSFQKRLLQGGDGQYLSNLRHYVVEIAEYRSHLESRIQAQRKHEMRVIQEVLKMVARNNVLEDRQTQCSQQQRLLLDKMLMQELDETELLRRARLLS